ncbi:MAG TPA: hypothetical protein PK625_07895, partial [Spirochaetales bacterium]|nr:hypothetical protein [Spirochaetales bacterium]
MSPGSTVVVQPGSKNKTPFQILAKNTPRPLAECINYDILRSRTLPRQGAGMAHTVLVINPGSTSTKIGVFEDQKELF